LDTAAELPVAKIDDRRAHAADVAHRTHTGVAPGVSTPICSTHKFFVVQILNSPQKKLERERLARTPIDSSKTIIFSAEAAVTTLPLR
jgi:hypothetical protein